MGLLNKAIGTAVKATGKVKDAAEKKVKEAKKKRQEEERKFFEQFPYKNMYIIRQKDSISVDLVLWEVLERDYYVVYDEKDIPIYIAKGTKMMGKHHFVVTNPEKQVVGKVKKALLNIPMPFMKEHKSCSIEIEGKEPFELETYISFNERTFDIDKKGLKIEVDSKEKEFQVKRGNRKKPIIHIYKRRSDEGFWMDKYVVGFDDEKDKMLAVFLTIGIDSIRYADN